MSVSKNHSQDGKIYAAVPVVGPDATINVCLEPKYVMPINAAECKIVELGLSRHRYGDVYLAGLTIVDIVGIVIILFYSAANSSLLPGATGRQNSRKIKIPVMLQQIL